MMMTTAMAVFASCCVPEGRKLPKNRTGSPKAASVTAWPSPQKMPSFPAVRVGTVFVGSDEGRDRGQMVGVGRMAQPEEERGDECERNHSLIREFNELFIESEHHASLRGPEVAPSQTLLLPFATKISRLLRIRADDQHLARGRSRQPAGRRTQSLVG